MRLLTNTPIHSLTSEIYQIRKDKRYLKGSKYVSKSNSVRERQDCIYICRVKGLYIVELKDCISSELRLK